MSNKLYFTLLASGMAGLIATAPGPKNTEIDYDKKYPIPEEIVVQETTTKFEERVIAILDNEGKSTGNKVTIKVVKTKDIDFGNDFKIKTDRYRIVKDNDWIPSRIVGHTVSCITKLLFWDSQVGWGLDEKRTKAVLAMVENDPKIKDLMVRINHNEGFYDWYRMMKEQNLRNNAPFLYRLTKGTWDTVIDEILAEFGRGDYYNPLTRTVVLYSNIESIGAHEIGHHVDFDKYPSEMTIDDPIAKWVYDISRYLPPIMLYQEWQASKNAKDIMSKEDEYQFRRYLIPAFYTYILSITFMILGYFFGKNREE